MSNDLKATLTLGVVFALVAVTVLWLTGGKEIHAALVSGVFTIFAAVGAAYIAFWQLRKQAENTLRANRDNEAMKLKKEVYAEVLPSIKKAEKIVGRLTSYLRLFVVELKISQNFEAKGQPVRLPSARFFKFNKMLGTMTNATAKLMRFTEEWEIIEPRSELFRIALHSALHDIEVLRTDYQRELTMTMPIENAEGIAYPWIGQNLDVEALEKSTEAFTEALNNLASYIHDIRIETQIFLLSDMFNKDVKRRTPLDPQYKVLRLDRYEELVAYFETTPQGVMVKSLNADKKK